MGALQTSFLDQALTSTPLSLVQKTSTNESIVIPIPASATVKRRGVMLLSKRMFDTAAVMMAAPVWLPLLAMTALAVKLDSRGPVFFRQKRTGMHGESFSIFKFRTMHQTACDADSGKQSRKEDSRHTRIGKWLRRSSLDELPQLLNVLNGDMSLIGPRPHARYHDKLFMEHVSTYNQRFRVRPGLTGLAQVHGSRGLLETRDQLQARTDFDNDYIEHWSLWMDIKILFKTVSVVLKATNAH